MRQLNQNIAEEYLDFIDGPIWESLVKYIKIDATIRRRPLLTSTTMSEGSRAGCIFALSTYKNFCTMVYESAGRKLPPELLELFTGDRTE
jgi:hypothetical protein